MLSEKSKLGLELEVLRKLAGKIDAIEERTNLILREIGKLRASLDRLMRRPLRDSVRVSSTSWEAADEEGVAELRRVDRGEARRLIQEYINANPKCLTSDIIMNLKLDPELVLCVLGELEDEGLITGLELGEEEEDG